MLRVLVVEDSGATRALVRAVLEQPPFADGFGGIVVEEASSGFDAMRTLPRGAFELLVTDVNMPDINGLELVRFVRRSETLRSLPIVIISTQSTSRDVDRALQLGAQTFVAKPFTPDTLHDACRRAIEAMALSQGSAAPSR